MYCKNCNSEIFEDSLVCAHCGEASPKKARRVKKPKRRAFLLSFAFTMLVMIVGATFVGLMFSGQNETKQLVWVQEDEVIYAYAGQTYVEAVETYTVYYEEYEFFEDETALTDKPESYEPYEAVAEELGSLSGKVIVLDAGHGNDGGGMIAGYREGTRMLFLARLIRDELEYRGATVLMIRDCGDDIHIVRRAAMMNRWSLEAIKYDMLGGSEHTEDELSEISDLIEMLDRIIADIWRYAQIYMNFPFDQSFTTRIHPSWQRMFELQSNPLITYNWLAISLHSNASYPFNEGINGAFVFYSSNTNPVSRPYFSDYSHVYNMRLFGNMLLDEIARIGIRRNRLTSSSYLFIRETNLPAILVENGFHTNPSDRALLSCDIFMQNLAIVYADIIEEYFLRIRYGES